MQTVAKFKKTSKNDMTKILNGEKCADSVVGITYEIKNIIFIAFFVLLHFLSIS